MKRFRLGSRTTRFAVALLAGTSLLRAQATAPAAADRPAEEDDAIRLSAFEVTSERDRGYVADKSVATTGFAVDLQKIPLAINVVTEQFLNDTGGMGFNGVAAYQAGFTTDQGGLDNGGRNTAGVSPVVGAVTGGEPLRNRLRGQPINVSQRNGLPMMFGFSTENVNRVEVARGPMAVFIGGSTLGGVLNLVTDKPAFDPSASFNVRYDSNDSYLFRANVTGPLRGDTLAYRVIAQYEDANTWRDLSDSQTTFINPQVTWRPFRNLTTRLEYAYRKRSGNTVSHAMQSTQNYQRDYDNPSQALLDLGKNRTGALAGVPYTAAEYRTRIARAFASWRADRYAVDGVWHSLGEGEAFIPGDWEDGYEANHFGPNDPYHSSYHLVESETNLFATEWLELRLLGRWMDLDSMTTYFSNALRRYPDGSTPLLSATNTSTKRHEEPLNGKLEAVFSQELFRVNHKLLLGYEIAFNQAWSVNPVWDYTKLGTVAASPNVAGSPATLTGANILNYFDPRVHEVPNYADLVAWADETLPAGVAAQFYSRSFPEAAYAAYSGSVWEDRITVFGGYRNSIIEGQSWTADRDGRRLMTSSITRRQSTQSHTIGLVFAPLPGLNFYASENIGEEVQTGSLINPTTTIHNGLVTAEERAANTVPNLEGYGREAGIKVEVFDRKLIGRLGVFDLSRRNTIVIDNERTANDPRNVGTVVDPNPATQNTAQTARVQWNRTIDGNRSSGIELSLAWMPNRNYTALLEASHLWTNELTINPPIAGTAPTSAAMIDYQILNGRPLDNTPDDTLRLWQKYAFTEGRLRSGWVGFGVRAQSSVMPVASTSSWGTVLPSWWVYDAAFGYTVEILDRPVELQLNVENLTDERYSAGGRAWSPPRTWTFQATTRF